MGRIERESNEAPFSPEKGPSAPGIYFGSYLPADCITNKEIERWGVQTSSGKLLTAEKIEKVTGIKKRYVADAYENPLYMGVCAAAEAFADNQNLHELYVSTSYPVGVNLSREIAQELGLNPKKYSDYHMACSGFAGILHDLYQNRFRTKSHRVGIIATEKYSDTLTDLATEGIGKDPPLAQTLFSDGAYAISFINGTDLRILSATQSRFPREVEEYIRMPIDYKKMMSPYRVQYVPSNFDPEKPYKNKFEQYGKGVSLMVKEGVPPMIKRVVESAGLEASDIAMVFPHQGSGPVVKGAIAEQLPEYNTYQDFEEGNFSSASIPRSLSKAWERGDIGRGDTIVIAGFGAGLFASACVVEFPLSNN